MADFHRFAFMLSGKRGKGQTASSFMLVEANMSHIGYVRNVLEVTDRVNRRVRY